VQEEAQKSGGEGGKQEGSPREEGQLQEQEEGQSQRRSSRKQTKRTPVVWTGMIMLACRWWWGGGGFSFPWLGCISKVVGGNAKRQVVASEKYRNPVPGRQADQAKTLGVDMQGLLIVQ